MHQRMLRRGVSWLTSCVMWYHGSLWSYHRFHIGHTGFELTLPGQKWCRVIIYICVRPHDIGRHFELIFLKFTWLMQVHPWMNLVVFGNNRPNRTINIGENEPLFGFLFSQYWIFCGENFIAVFGTYFP